MVMSLQSVLLLFVASLDLLLGAIIFFQNSKSVTSRAFFIFALSVAGWGFGVSFFLSYSSPSALNFLARFLYFMGGSIPATFLFFAKIFNTQVFSKKWLLIFLPTLIFIPVYFFTNLIISGYFIDLTGVRNFEYGSLHYLFDIHLWCYFLWAFFELLRKYRFAIGQTKTHILFLTLGTYAVLAIAGVSNVIQPSILHISNYIAIGPIATLIWIVITAYAVSKHQLFNIRVVATEVLVFAFIIFLTARVLFSSDAQETLINFIFLVGSLILGLILIRNVIREIKAREQIENLATQLGFANEKLKGLDQLKNEFLSIASHQLRAPITAIRGYASLILEGDYGPSPEKLKEPLMRIADSSRAMANSIEDYLNISRIEQGRMKYEKSPFNLTDITKKTVEEFIPVAERKGLTLTLGSHPDELMVNADVGKIKQAITNLIDNAIKYTEKGGITVSLEEKEGKAQVSVSDTGIGIPSEEIGGLFEKFIRARGANQVNISGTGLGLYVAKQLVEGHGGKIWAESAGAGKGSKFTFQIPK